MGKLLVNMRTELELSDGANHKSTGWAGKTFPAIGNKYRAPEVGTCLACLWRSKKGSVPKAGER